MTADRTTRTVITLGVAQTLAWGSTYYLPALLAAPMARDLGVATPTVFAAFSLALAVAALLGPAAGRWIDRHGGRMALAASNGVFAAGLGLMALAEGPAQMVLAWLVIGVGMSAGLYDAAFATLVRLHGGQARAGITGITLIAGFASTVGWPLSAWMESHWDWRGACAGWALLHLAIGLPLNLSVPRATHPPHESPPAPHAPDTTSGAGPGSAADSPGAPLTDATGGSTRLRQQVLLSLAFTLVLFVSTAMAAHLPQILVASGLSLAAAVALGGLIGPAQVGGRLLEFGVLRRLHPLLSARLAASLHPVGALALLVLGAPGAAAFCLLHGAGNGILTVARGTLPLALFGPSAYGRRQGFLLVPAGIAQALAPWVFGLCVEAWGVSALYLSSGLGMLMLGTLLALRVGHRPET
jgi:predicted MFS family arabinose efflux permease